jgi:hypothetical protein
MTHCIAECERKFYFCYLRNVGLEGEPDYYVSGRAWDAAIGAFETKGNLRLRYEAAVKAINKVYDETTCEYFKPIRERDNVLALLERYVEEFPTPDYTVMAHNLPLKIEIAPRLFLGGELDKYMQWEPYGLVIGETKTSNQVPGSKYWDSYMAQFRLGQYAHQIDHYNMVVERAIGRKPWGTCVFTACLDIPKRATTVRQLFSRIWIEHNEARSRDWLDTIQLQNEKAKWCWENWTWPPSGQRCTGAYGTAPCEYRFICQLGMELHELNELPAIYVPKGKWAPWDGIKRKEVKGDENPKSI